MTEYDVHKMYKEIVEREKISYLHANNGVIELGYADGTKEVYKKSKWRNKYIKIRNRT
tara:strand:- start:187 stop:360 length:174 start_codon:yes stop_codon:yes gene_type:complete